MRVLGIVDFENCFMVADPNVPGTGELPVPGAVELADTINELAESGFFDYVWASRCWHDPEMVTFTTQQPGKTIGEHVDVDGIDHIVWPPHGRQRTPGANFHPTLNLRNIHLTWNKGMDKRLDAHSAFWANGHVKSTGLGDRLREEALARGFDGIEMYIVGVTRPVCITYTVKDSVVKEKFPTTCIIDACSLLDLSGDGGASDRKDMEDCGATIATAKEVLARWTDEKCAEG